MKQWFPRKRVILAAHRWLGAAAALFLVVLSLTGLALNHSKELGLDQLHVQSQFILGRYGMSHASEIQSVRIHGTDTLSNLEGRLYHEGNFLSGGGPIVGVHEGSELSLIACSDSVILVSKEGELVETIEASRLPFKPIMALGYAASGSPVIASGEGAWQMDNDWIQFIPFEGEYTVRQRKEVSTPLQLAEKIMTDYQGAGPSLSKVLLDLHSGRIFGWGGRTIMDLTAVAILLLVSSGISGWLRKSRRGNRG